MAQLEIRVLGELRVLRAGTAVPLPASRKTRALLGFLAVTARPHRRDRLCELFWEIPDDPRGALRWSLSKLRAIVNDDEVERIAADRERAAFVAEEAVVDLQELAARLEDEALDEATLRAFDAALEEPLLEGADLPEQEVFQRWLIAEREQARRLQARVIARLAALPSTPPDAAVRFGRRWLELEPFSAGAALQVLDSLRRAGRDGDAQAVESALRRRFQAAGIPWPSAAAGPAAARSQPDPGNGLGLARGSPGQAAAGPAAAPGGPQPSPTAPSHPAAAPGNPVPGAPHGAAAGTGVTPPPNPPGPGTLAAIAQQDEERAFLARQTIHFCTARDGVRIAYATVGEGPPLVKAANWLSHLELDWNAPIWSPLFRRLAREHFFVRYDERGNGLSDWDVESLDFEDFVTDLESVVDALGIERFALLGISQGASVSIEYAVRHPERVSHLVIFGGYAAGWRVAGDPALIREREAEMTLTETGWGRDIPAYRQIFSSTFMPGATPEELSWFNEFQRQTTSAENAVRFQAAFGDIDVRHCLDRLRVPTLVLHSRGDRRIPFETGRDLAARIPDAEFVSLESDGHLLLGREPASAAFLEAVRRFLAASP